MTDGFFSVFDGLPQLANGYDPPSSVCINIPTPAAGVTVSAGVAIGSDGDGTDVALVEIYLKEKIATKAKLSNDLTKELVKKYHDAFLVLHRKCQAQISQLEAEVLACKNPLRTLCPLVELHPEDVEVKPEITEYIIRAMNEGVDLLSILPPEYLPTCH